MEKARFCLCPGFVLLRQRAINSEENGGREETEAMQRDTLEFDFKISRQSMLWQSARAEVLVAQTISACGSCVDAKRW